MVPRKSAIRKKPRTTNVMSKKAAHSYLMNLASRLNLDLRDSDLEETRKILSKGKSLSAIVREMRER
jgi:hypothetical protein